MYVSENTLMVCNPDENELQVCLTLAILFAWQRIASEKYKNVVIWSICTETHKIISPQCLDLW